MGKGFRLYSNLLLVITMIMFNYIKWGCSLTKRANPSGSSVYKAGCIPSLDITDRRGGRRKSQAKTILWSLWQRHLLYIRARGLKHCKK
ncbi:hypothetical protein FKM82_006351 [Ascaphus truei]